MTPYRRCGSARILAASVDSGASFRLLNTSARLLGKRVAGSVIASECVHFLTWMIIGDVATTRTLRGVANHLGALGFLSRTLGPRPAPYGSGPLSRNATPSRSKAAWIF
jgi:hypothetical protein